MIETMYYHNKAYFVFLHYWCPAKWPHRNLLILTLRSHKSRLVSNSWPKHQFRDKSRHTQDKPYTCAMRMYNVTVTRSTLYPPVIYRCRAPELISIFWESDYSTWWWRKKARGFPPISSHFIITHIGSDNIRYDIC